jgi:Phosphoesterase family
LLGQFFADDAGSKVDSTPQAGLDRIARGVRQSDGKSERCFADGLQPHHEPFEYYPQSSNRHHPPPSSVARIGQTDRANHQYDLTDFWDAVKSGNMPAVSFLKAKRSQDGHAGYPSPLDEQIFLVNTLNALNSGQNGAARLCLFCGTIQMAGMTT